MDLRSQHALAFIITLGILLTLSAPVNAGPCPNCAQCGGGQPFDVFVCGCPPPGSGQIGFSDLSGDETSFIDVDVDIFTNSDVSTFSFDLYFPKDLIRYDTAIPGNLTSNFFLFGGELQPSLDVVRVVGVVSSTNPIPSGTSGTIAKIRFEVENAGCGAFCMVALEGHLQGYDTCSPSTDAPSSWSVASWGEVKATYR